MSFFLNDLSSIELLIWTAEKDELVNKFMGQMGHGRKMDGSDLGAEAMRDWTPEDRFRGFHFEHGSAVLGRKPKHELVLKVKAATVQNTGGPLRLLETIWKLNGSPSNVVPSGYLNTQDFGGAGYTFIADGKEYQNRVSRFIYLFYASDDKKALNRFKKFGHEYEYEKGSQKTKWSFVRRGGRGTVIEKYLGMFRKAKSKSNTAKRKAAIKKSPMTVSSAKKSKSLPKMKQKQMLVNLAVGDNKNLKFKIGKKKVPEKMKKTPRSKATKLYVFPGRKSYPIGDLYHARAATLRVMWTSNKKNRGKVLRAVVTVYPQYNWKAYWEKERKEAKNKRNIKTYGQTIKQK